MSGSDSYDGTGFTVGSWSNTVTYTPAASGAPATVEVGGLGASTVSLSGTVAAQGDAVTLTIDTGVQPVQEQLQAVCDIAGGALFSDGAGGEWLFADGALTQGATYDAAPGFGHFAGGPPSPACFAAGTRIEARRGLVPVEELRPGDEVRAIMRAQRGGGWAPVIWTGQRRIDCARHPRPGDVWPVRIAAGAFGPGRPRRDLFLSPDHALSDGEGLVPVRYLLNDATVAQVRSRHVTYWHVELPSHDLLLAEGLEAESYLDTGNRAAFQGGGPALLLAPDIAGHLARRVWEERACAKLKVHASEHRALRRLLRDRALSLGWTETADAALALRVGGTVIGAGWDGAEASALLPAGVSEVRLCSRAAVPSRCSDAATDSRRLGVAVTRLRLDGREIALDDPRLSLGWHRPEGGWRWTDGEAAIPLTAGRPARRLEILTAPMLTYWEPPRHCEAAVQAA